MTTTLPQKSMMVFATADGARWNLLAGVAQGPQLGLQCVDLAGLVAEVGEALWGAPRGDLDLLEQLGQLLARPQHRTRFGKALADDAASRLLRRALLQQLTAWLADVKYSSLSTTIRIPHA
ncbi:MAG: hypothetical protein ACOYOB_21495, partial [Myxococcota bacterium]